MKTANPLRLAGKLPESYKLRLKRDFKNYPDESHPDGIYIENYCDLPHKMGYALKGSYALVYGGNKHFLMTQPVKDFTMFIACGVDPLFATGYGLYVFFHYDKESRHGGVMLIEAGTDEMGVSVGYAEGNQYTLSERTEIKGDPSGIMIRGDGNHVTVSAGGVEAVFELPQGIPERGSIGFDRRFFAGPLMLSDIELWTPDKPAASCELWPKHTYEFPKSLTAFESRWAFSFATCNSGPISQIKAMISGGPVEREKTAAFNGLMPNEELVNPYFKLVMPNGEIGNKHYIFHGRIGLKEHWNNEQPFLPPADAECPIEREFTFEDLPDDCRLLIGYERHWEEDHLQHSGAAAEMLVSPKTGTILFAGKTIATRDVIVSVDSGANKRICELIPKDVFKYEDALSFAAGNHYFFESESCDFNVALRFRETELSASELAVEAQLEDVFYNPQGDTVKLGFGKEIDGTIPGEFEIHSSVNLGRLPVGVYHLALRLSLCGKPSRNEHIAFEVLGETTDALCPPLASGLPELFSLHADNISFTDHFDPWSAAGVDMSHYFSINTFQPLFAAKSKPWTLLRLYGRKWLLWLQRRTTPCPDPHQNEELIKNADYCTGTVGRLMLAENSSYSPEVREQLKLFLERNNIVDGPLDARSFDPAQPLERSTLELLLVNHGGAWMEFISAWRDENVLKESVAVFRAINPALRVINYGFYATYVACLKGGFHCLETGWDLRRNPEKHCDAFAIFEDYPFLCGYPIQRTIYMLAATKLDAPRMKLYPELYSIKAVPRDRATIYGRPPYGMNQTEVYAKRFYEYAYGTAWFRDGKFHFWNDKGFHFSNLRREEMDIFLYAWNVISKTPPAKPVRTVAYVTGTTCCVKHKEAVSGMISGGKAEIDLFNTAEEFPAFINEATRLGGQPAGFVTRPEDLAKLSPEDVHTLVLPPLSILEKEELDAVRKLHAEGVSLLCAEDVEGMEEAFGVVKSTPVSVIKIEGGESAETTDSPLCVSSYKLGKAEMLLKGFSALGEETPVLTVHKNKNAFAALYTIPPTVVRKMEVGEKHCNGGRSSISELINRSAIEIMNKIGAPTVRASEGRLIAFNDEFGKLRIIVTEDAHPAPAKPIHPEVVIIKKKRDDEKIDCDCDFTVLERSDEAIHLRLHLCENDSAIINIH